MRVTTSSMYGRILNNLFNSSERLVDLNIKSGSQKNINKPSDDPMGTLRVMGYNDSIAALKQYKKNIDTSRGWLNLADETLQQVNVQLVRLKSIAEQAATGTLTPENREQISYEAKQIFEQLIALSNTEFEGKSIFSGHKLEEDAYARSMGLTANKDNVPQATISGKVGGTILVQFTSAGEVGTDALNYRFSSDGGKTWEDGTLAAGSRQITLGDTRIDFQKNFTVEATDIDNTNDSSGTWLWARPTATYKGDDNNFTVWDGGGNIQGTALGRNIPEGLQVRYDGPGVGTIRNFSYSLDGGGTWTAVSASDQPYQLEVSGGKVVLGSLAGVAAGTVMTLSKNKGDLQVEISEEVNIQINSVGLNIFGGQYKVPGSGDLYFKANEGESNLFEAVGELVGYLETNNQDGCGKIVARLRAVQSEIGSRQAVIGARVNRLDAAKTVTEGLIDNEKKRKSSIEDVKVEELMTEMRKEEFIYEAVLRSSSMIMKMSLMNYM